MKTKAWIIIFAVLCILLAAAAFLTARVRTGVIANVYSHGRCIRSIDLSAVTEAYSFTVEDDEGHINTVEVEHGRIRVVEANCPDRVCVNTGWLSHGLRPIVCMPAKLVIRLESSPAADEGFDSVTGLVPHPEHIRLVPHWEHIRLSLNFGRCSI